MAEQAPSVGRVVHYVSFGTPGGEYTSQCRAAVITEVTGRLAIDPTSGDPVAAAEIVGLAVLNPTGMFFNQDIVHDDEHKRGGTWHWPERV